MPLLSSLRFVGRRTNVLLDSHLPLVHRIIGKFVLLNVKCSFEALGHFGQKLLTRLVKSIGLIDVRTYRYVKNLPLFLNVAFRYFLQGL